MSKRYDIKKLFYVLAGLLVILLLTVVVKIPKQRSTLKEKLVSIDTSDVRRIVFIPKVSVGEPFEFVKENNKWSIVQGKIKAEPVKNAIENIFSELMQIKPQSLVAIDKSRWMEYELTDSLATRIKLFDEKGKKIVDLMIGKFSYKQVNNPYSYGGNNVEGTSYVRLSDDKKIYAVDGFLAFSFSGKFNDWRDKSFLKFKKEDLTKITFTVPADSSFVLSKRDSVWYAGNQKTDSLTTSNYFSMISFLNGEEVNDDFKPASAPTFQVAIEGNNLLNITVKCYYSEGKDEYVMNSSLNPDVYFTSKRTGLFDKLFKPLNYFLKPEQKNK